MGQQEQVATLRGVQLQYPRQVVQKCRRHTNITALFQPCVPSQADASQRCDFFTTKSWRAPSSATGQADLFGSQMFSVNSQESGQIRG